MHRCERPGESERLSDTGGLVRGSRDRLRDRMQISGKAVCRRSRSQSLRCGRVARKLRTLQIQSRQIHGHQLGVL